MDLQANTAAATAPISLTQIGIDTLLKDTKSRPLRLIGANICRSAEGLATPTPCPTTRCHA